jgi:gliding motility-associated-like protein
LSVTEVDTKLANNTSEVTINDPSKGELVGLSKVCGEAKIIGPQQYEVPFTIFVTNMGSTTLSKIQVVDDLDRAFGNGAVILDSLIKVEANEGLTGSVTYTGRGTTIKLLNESLSTLAVGKKAAINFKVKVDLSKANIDDFYNIATVTVGGTTDSTTTTNANVLTDLSTNGFSADPDGDPSNNDEPSPIQLALSIDPSKPAIGVALSIVDTVAFDAKAYDVTYMAIIQNLGAVNLTNVVLIDSLAKTFTDTLEYTIIGKPMVNSGSTLVVNDDFDGKANPSVISGIETSTLAVGKAYTVYYTVRLFHEKNSGPYFNSVIVKGTAGGVIAVDTSNNGVNIIPTENSATAFSIPVPLNILVVIPEGFSPNGDTFNDVYKLKIPTGTTLEEYHIYNRWGHLVYVDKGGKVIKEGWDGKSNTGILFETNGVPDGTYFYSIKLSNEENRRVGFITVAR